MIKIGNFIFNKSFEDIVYLKNYVLYKKGKEICLCDSQKNIYSKLPFPYYINRLICNEQKTLLLPLNSIFSNNVSIYSLPSLKELKNIEFDNQFVKSALFAHDESYLYVLTDTSDSCSSHSILWEINLEDFTSRSYFSDDDLHITSIFTSSTKDSLLLVTDNGDIHYFRNGKILKTIHLGKFKKVFDIDDGNYFLTDARLGMHIFTNTGKKLSNMYFIIPRINKSLGEEIYDEEYYDFLYSADVKLIFYLTYLRKTKRFNLYVFSADDFSLQAVKLGLKRPCFGLNFQNGNLLYKTAGGICRLTITLS